MKTRDMSAREFAAAIKRNGITPHGFMGYHGIGFNTYVCALNAGPRRRDQLAYLLRERDRAEREQPNAVVEWRKPAQKVE